MAATAERFGQRPSDLLSIPPDRDWLRYCVDEALHTLAAGHAYRDQRWNDRWREEPGEGDGDLYKKYARDPKMGKPPGQHALAALDYAAEYSGVRRDGDE